MPKHSGVSAIVPARIADQRLPFTRAKPQDGSFQMPNQLGGGSNVLVESRGGRLRFDFGIRNAGTVPLQVV
jgi:hypothetical protein